MTSVIISQLQTWIKKGRLDKAGTALQDFPRFSEKERQQVREILALAPNDTALLLLEALLTNPAIAEEDRDALFQLIIDRAHIHSAFVLLLLYHAPFILINRSVPLIRHILNQETDPDILGKIIRITGEKKINALTDEVTEYLFYGESTLKSLAIQALVRMSSPESLKRLAQVSGTSKCDEEILEAIDDLEIKIPAISREVDKLNIEKDFSQKDEKFLKDLASGHPHKQFQAFRYFAQSGEKVFQAVSRLDETCDLSLRITLLRLVAMTIPQKAIRLLLDILVKEKPKAALKFIVYNALQAYPHILGSPALIKGATDSVSHVRIAALKMFNKHCTDFIIAEFKRQIESGTKTGEDLARAIVDSRAEKLINKLIGYDSFSYIAFLHIETNASILVMDTFIQALEKRGMKSSVRRCEILRQKRLEKKLPRIMVVNPSPACLDAFSAKISPAGYETMLFRSTQEAFEKLMEEKPAALVTGIFLGDMHCIDFIKEVRTLYPKDQLPVIVSSIMPIDIDTWEKTAGPTGITAWYNFPPKVSDIASWIPHRQ